MNANDAADNSVCVIMQDACCSVYTYSACLGLTLVFDSYFCCCAQVRLVVALQVATQAGPASRMVHVLDCLPGLDWW